MSLDNNDLITSITSVTNQDPSKLVVEIAKQALAKPEKKPLSEKKKEALAKAHAKLAESRVMKRMEKKHTEAEHKQNEIEEYIVGLINKHVSTKESSPAKPDVVATPPMKATVASRGRGRPKKTVPPAAPASIAVPRPYTVNKPKASVMTHDDKVNMLYSILKAK